jgi:hypothetical protein
MFEPSGPKPASEWFEVYNTAAAARTLNGLVIRDGYLRVHVISADTAVLVPPRTYTLLVRDRAAALANRLPAEAIVYEYGAGLPPDRGIQLDDDSNGDISLWNNDDVELADVPYGSWFLPTLAQTLELFSLQLVGSDTSANWCFAQLPWAIGSDDGTPGKATDCP